jgi:hypothetical protein
VLIVVAIGVGVEVTVVGVIGVVLIPFIINFVILLIAFKPVVLEQLFCCFFTIFFEVLQLPFKIYKFEFEL